MSFINGQHVFTGPEGYRIKPGKDGMFMVVSFTAAGERPVYGGIDLSEQMARVMVARLMSKRAAK